MTYSDLIQLSLAILTFLGLVTVWTLPKIMNCRIRKAKRNRIKKRVSLYLDVFEIKSERELSLIFKGYESDVESKKFEQYNMKNYRAIENILQEADVLDDIEYNKLMEFVRDFKTSPNMQNKSDVESFLNKIRDKDLRSSFPEGANLKIAIDKAKSIS